MQRAVYKNVSVPPGAIKAALNHPSETLFSFKPYDRYDADSKTFTLLNLQKSYPDKIDWNEAQHGLLWAYHLNYFSWLEDEDLSIDARRETILQFVSAKDSLKVGLSPYTISLRSFAWIRFCLNTGAPDEATLQLLYRHLYRLYCIPEYEIDGNHLWENSVALVAGGAYFQEAKFSEKGSRIMRAAVKDQMAPDRMHIEGSPMYHRLLLLRTIMCIEILQALKSDDPTLGFLKMTASAMLGWVDRFSFRDDSYPMVNDSAAGVAPTNQVLRSFAARLNIKATTSRENGSYRMYRNSHFELLYNVGNILPPWQPGHHHADTFSFCLHSAGGPVIVDAGISTYEEGEERNFQRSTAAHNTISIDGLNSSDVWKSFRVGRRAVVKIISESPDSIIASHDGYRALGIIHERIFRFSLDKIIIEDKLIGIEKQKALLHLHFHPSIEIKKIGVNQYLARDLLLTIDSPSGVSLAAYFFAEGFNKTTEAQRLIIEAESYTRITIERTHINAD